MTEGTYVPSEGPLNAKIVILGESPWVNEVSSGRPFAGDSGNLMKKWWPLVGLKRTEMRLMNLYPWRPPSREITSVPVERIVRAIEGVHDRIAKLQALTVIIPMGNYATFALTGKGKVKADVRRYFEGSSMTASEADKKAGITFLRGSIYPYQDLKGRLLKVIPMIHPAAVLNSPKWEKRSKIDWQRVARESQFPEIRDPQRQCIINPSIEQVNSFIEMVRAMGSSGKMSIDIETWQGLNCVGFAVHPFWSITLPFEAFRAEIKWLCESPVPKVLCGGLYDWYWLDAEGIRIEQYIYDVQCMHHAFDPAENHSLNHLSSIFCPHFQYWKDEAKEAEEIMKYVRDMDALYHYNGLDCCYTRELVDILEAKLHAEGMWEFYVRHYVRMFEPLLRTMRHGLRVDVEAQKREAKKLRAEMRGLHTELNALAGYELFATEVKSGYREPTEEEWRLLAPQHSILDGPPPAKEIKRQARDNLIEKGLTYMMTGKNAGKIRFKKEVLRKTFSGPKLMHFFYDILHLPRQKKWRKATGGGERKKTDSLDDAALRKLMMRFHVAEKPGSLLLQYREKEKELEYLVGAWDKDGRVRCTYKLLTNAGRLSSSKNPMRTGLNLQNLKR